jgi:hypothetical protein
MKIFKIEGEINKESILLLNEIGAMKIAIIDLSITIDKHRKTFWSLIKKQYPGLSDNCKAEIVNDSLLITDRDSN